VKESPGNALKWLTANDDLIRSQLARRADPDPGRRRPGPESTGPLEAHIKWLRHRLAYRAQSLRNAPRTNQLLRLMVAGRNGQADERAWAERIRQHLVANDGQAPRQRQLVGAGGLRTRFVPRVRAGASVPELTCDDPDDEEGDRREGNPHPDTQDPFPSGPGERPEPDRERSGERSGQDDPGNGQQQLRQVGLSTAHKGDEMGPLSMPRQMGTG
jgi:hypothetical protein